MPGVQLSLQICLYFPPTNYEQAYRLVRNIIQYGMIIDKIKLCGNRSLFQIVQIVQIATIFSGKNKDNYCLIIIIYKYIKYLSI